MMPFGITHNQIPGIGRPLPDPVKGQIMDSGDVSRGPAQLRLVFVVVCFQKDNHESHEKEPRLSLCGSWFQFFARRDVQKIWVRRAVLQPLVTLGQPD